MIEKKIRIYTKEKEIANKVYIPETEKEKAKGLYGMKLKDGEAMLFVFARETYHLFDMMWMEQRIGYIALDIMKRIVDVGIMRPWFSFKFLKCSIFIETQPKAIEGLGKNDVCFFTENYK